MFYVKLGVSAGAAPVPVYGTAALVGVITAMTRHFVGIYGMDGAISNDENVKMMLLYELLPVVVAHVLAQAAALVAVDTCIDYAIVAGPIGVGICVVLGGSVAGSGIYYMANNLIPKLEQVAVQVYEFVLKGEGDLQEIIAHARRDVFPEVL